MIVTEQELLKTTGYDSRGWLEKWLAENGIQYFRAKDGLIWTTIGLIEAAKLARLKGKAPAARPIEF